MYGRRDGGEITLADINETLRREQKSRMLLSIPQDFYVMAQEYISSLEEEIREREEEISPSPDIMELEELKRKSEVALRKIFMERLRKVLLLVYANVDREMADTGRLTREEKLFYEAVLEQARDVKKSLLGVGPSGRRRRLWYRLTQKRKRAVKGRGEGEGEEEEGSKEEPSESTLESLSTSASHVDATSPQAVLVGAEVSEETTDGGGVISMSGDVGEDVLEEMAVILVLEEIPPFAGPSGEYRLRPQDIAAVPRKMAEILAEKTGKAKILE